MTIDELINRINAYADPDPDSEWKFGKNYGLMLAVGEIKKWGEEHEYIHRQIERNDG